MGKDRRREYPRRTHKSAAHDKRERYAAAAPDLREDTLEFEDFDLEDAAQEEGAAYAYGEEDAYGGDTADDTYAAYDDAVEENPYDEETVDDDQYGGENGYVGAAEEVPTEPKKKRRRKCRRRRKNKRGRAAQGQKSRKRRHIFLWCMLLYVLVAVIVSIVLYRRLWSYIEDYETSLPKYGMDPVMAALAPDGDGIRSLLTPDTLVQENRYTDYERYVELLAARMDGKEIRFEEASGASAEHPRYLVYADDAPVMEVTLAVTGQNAHGMNLWGPAQYDADKYLLTDEYYEITAPVDANVTINGVAAGEDTLVREADGTVRITQAEDLAPVAQYLEEIPSFVSYTVSGLFETPVIAATAADGTELAFKQEGNVYTAVLPVDDAAVAEVSENLDAIMEAYGKHFIGKDAAGIYPYLLPDSDYRASVRSVDVSWFPTSHITSFEFRDKTADNFITYTPDCVACDVGFDLMVYFDAEAYKTQNRGMDATWIFIRRDGTWYLAQVLRQKEREQPAE